MVALSTSLATRCLNKKQSKVGGLSWPGSTTTVLGAMNITLISKIRNRKGRLPLCLRSSPKGGRGFIFVCLGFFFVKQDKNVLQIQSKSAVSEYVPMSVLPCRSRNFRKSSWLGRSGTCKQEDVKAFYSSHVL